MEIIKNKTIPEGFIVTDKSKYMFKGKIGVNCFELFRVEKHHDNIRLLIKGTVKTNVDGSGSKIIVKQTVSEAGKIFSLLWVISLLFSIFLIIAGALVGDQVDLGIIICPIALILVGIIYMRLNYYKQTELGKMELESLFDV